MTPDKVTETVFVGAQVPVDITEALKKRAAAADRSLSAEVRSALRAYVATDEEKAA